MVVAALPPTVGTVCAIAVPAIIPHNITIVTVTVDFINCPASFPRKIKQGHAEAPAFRTTAVPWVSTKP